MLDDPQRGAVLPVRLDFDLPQHALWEVQALLLLVGSRHQVLPLDYRQESLNLEGLESNFQTRAPLALTCPCATRTWSAFTSSLLGEPCSSARGFWLSTRSEEHTSELQSRLHLVCRLLLEKKKKNMNTTSLHTPR